MLAPIFSAADFASAIRRLKPPGKLWPRDTDTVQAAIELAFGMTYQRLHARDVNLLTDTFPATAVEMLPEWEASLGLPDPCAGVAPTLAARQAAVVARFAGTGGQSQFFFINYLATLGYIVGVTMFAPFRTGRSRTGTPLYGEDWAYTWAVTAPLFSVNYFRTGAGCTGEPLAFWNNTVLECEIKVIKPAHTIVLFEYS